MGMAQTRTGLQTYVRSTSVMLGMPDGVVCSRVHIFAVSKVRKLCVWAGPVIRSG